MLTDVLVSHLYIPLKFYVFDFLMYYATVSSHKLSLWLGLTCLRFWLFYLPIFLIQLCPVNGRETNLIMHHKKRSVTCVRRKKLVLGEWQKSLCIQPHPFICLGHNSLQVIFSIMTRDAWPLLFVTTHK